MLPKVMEILECAPEVYEAAELFIDAGDWINLLLTGEDHRSACAAGCLPVMVPDLDQPGEDTKALLFAKADTLTDIISLIQRQNGQ